MAPKRVALKAVTDPFPTEGLDPLRLMAQLPIRPYQNIIDVRCAAGHFTIPLAKFLFDGRIYARDTTIPSLDELKQRLTKARLGNVEVITTKKQQRAIAAKSLDGALLPFILHQVEEREAFLQETLALLKRGAWVAVLEWQKNSIDGGPPMNQRMDDAEVIALGGRWGLQLTSKRIMTPKHYLVLLRK